MSELKSENYIEVAEDENEEPIELPIEDDGTLLLSTLTAQFPGSSCLKYRSAKTKNIRGIRLSDERLHPPEGGWSDNVYFCVFPKENKRKSEDVLENSTPKTKKIEFSQRCSDLIVLNLPWKTTEEDVRNYFEKFGELMMVQLKKNPSSGQSKGFAFIRYVSYDVQKKVLNKRHFIDGRWCDVKIPNSKDIPTYYPCKIFVGRITENITADNIRSYFEQFGPVTDVFMPRPFRSFCFVTFEDSDVMEKVFDQDHIIKNVSVHVSNATPKPDKNKFLPMAFSNSNVGQIPAYNDEMKFNFSNDVYHRPTTFHGRNNGMTFSPQRELLNSGNRNAIWTPNSKSNLDMPNLQNLGINGRTASCTTNPNNLFGMGVQVTPALLAAALNQVASWGLLNEQSATSTSSPENKQSGSKRGGPSYHMSENSWSKPYDKQTYHK